MFHGFIGKVQTHLFFYFSGNAILAVGMISPSGHGEAELSMKKTSNTAYTVTYTCKEAGEHVLSVKYGDEDIPGSPFSIHT